MRFKGLITLLFLILTAFGVTSFAQDQGENFMSAGKVIVSLQLAAGQVRVADTNGQVSSIFFPYDQNGLELGASYGLSNHWAVSLSGNLGFSSYKNEYPDTIAGVPAKIEDKVKSSAWGIRGGLDCYIQVSDKFVIFAGPGLMFNRAKINHEVKIEPDTLPFFPGNDNPWTNSISLSGVSFSCNTIWILPVKSINSANVIFPISLLLRTLPPVFTLVPIFDFRHCSIECSFSEELG